MTKHPHPIQINIEEEIYQELKEISNDYENYPIEDLINDYLDWYLVNMFTRNFKPVRDDTNDIYEQEIIYHEKKFHFDDE